MALLRAHWRLAMAATVNNRRRHAHALSLLRRLDGSLDERAGAASELQAMGPDGVDLLLWAVRHEVPPGRARAAGLWLACLATWLGAAYLGAVVGWWLARALAYGIGGVPAVLPALAAAAGVAFGLLGQRSLRRMGARALAAHGGVRALGFLAEAAVADDEEAHAPARLALVELLPELSRDDAHYLGPPQRARLWQLLPVAEEDLVLAVLGFAERAGDTSALPAVERLAGGAGVRARDAGVRLAAARCLDALRPVAAREHAARSLLRPAASAEPAPDEALLRPVDGDPGAY